MVSEDEETDAGRRSNATFWRMPRSGKYRRPCFPEPHRICSNEVYTAARLSCGRQQNVRTIQQQLILLFSHVRSLNITRLDPMYDAEKEQAFLHSREHELMPELELDHAMYLNPQWEPNADWWGSQVVVG